MQRERNIAEIPALQISTATSNDEKIAVIVKNLSDRVQSRPRKIKTLSNTINSLFNANLSEQQLTALTKELEKKKYIKLNDGNVSSQLPH